MASHMLLLMRPLRTVSSFYTAGRKPLITFPIRRDQDGRPLTETSLDAFFGSNTASQATNGNDNKMAHLPFDHGRKPISEEEMIAINTGGAT